MKKTKIVLTVIRHLNEHGEFEVRRHLTPKETNYDFKCEFINSNLFGKEAAIEKVKHSYIKINDIDRFLNWTNQLLRKDIANNIHNNEVWLEQLIKSYTHKQNLTEKDHNYFDGLFKYLKDNLTNVLISDYQIVTSTDFFNNELERIKDYFTNKAKLDEKYTFIIEYENKFRW